VSVVRVLLADDHTMVRAGLRALLEGMQGITVVAEAGNGRAARSIEIALSGAVDDIGPVAGHGGGVGLARIAMEDVGVCHAAMVAQTGGGDKPNSFTPC